MCALSSPHSVEHSPSYATSPSSHSTSRIPGPSFLPPLIPRSLFPVLHPYPQVVTSLSNAVKDMAAADAKQKQDTRELEAKNQADRTSL